MAELIAFNDAPTGGSNPWLDSLVYGKREWVPAAAEFIEGDIRDITVCAKAVAGMDGVLETLLRAFIRAYPDLFPSGGSAELSAKRSWRLGRRLWRRPNVWE